MAFITNSLPNNGQTAHFGVSYSDGLSKSAGLDVATGLMNSCEQDLALIISWFNGVRFQFAFPIQIQIGETSEGGGWVDPPDSFLPFGFHPSVTLDMGANGTANLARYLLVAEVTEMYMASQRKQWFEPTNIFSGGDEGSMGESLSRFLATQFLRITGISQVTPAGFGVVPIWLDSPLRPDFVDVSADDNMPDLITGCGTCFLFYLHDQLGFSINQIVDGAGDTLAQVYQHLTGKADAWLSFSDLVNLHYPLDGTIYSPPMETIFPVADLASISAPRQASWVSNGPAPVAWVFLTQAIPVGVKVTLSSSDPRVISVPASIITNHSVSIPLTLRGQAAGFVESDVVITAQYAGKTADTHVQVVRPENLTMPPLTVSVASLCEQRYVAGASEDFLVLNPNVFLNESGLVYHWTVSGAIAPVTDQPVLSIPTLPAAGTTVTVSVSVRNSVGLQATGSLTFNTAQKITGLAELLRQLDCSIQRFRAINSNIPRQVPVDGGSPLNLSPEQMTQIKVQAQRVAQAAKALISSFNGQKLTESVSVAATRSERTSTTVR
jgi:hypothetical protein